jgi:8-oxo-dGTP pyrophosphatase MutT (NUDIX family)
MSKIRIYFWRSYYFVINPFRRLFWRIVKPQTRGVKVVARRDGKFLLVKLAYGPKYWTFPGGGVHRNETFEQAARREFYEETGIEADDITFLGQYESSREGKRDIVQCFYCEPKNPSLKTDPLEISVAAWLDPGEFPENRSSRVDQILALIPKA